MDLAENDSSGKPNCGSAEAFGDFIGRRADKAHPKPAPSPAVAFLQALDPAGWHNLVRFDPTEQRSHPIGLTIPPGRWDIAERFVAEFAGRENLYFSVNEPKPDAPDKKLEKQDIAAIRAIPADIDLPGANDEAAVAALQAKVAADCAGLPAPSFTIDSGGGVQAHWMLAEKMPATAEAVEWAESQGRAIARELGGDAVGNVDRVMRLPGTLNVPDAGKRAKGRVARPTSLIGTTGATHAPDTLRAALPPIPKAMGDALDKDGRIAEQQREFAASWADVAGATTFDDLPSDLRERFGAALADSDRLTVLWAGEPPRSGDISGSGYRAALAQALARAGGFDAFDFASLAWVWEFAVQAGHDREEKLTPRALARDWCRIGETTSSQAELAAQWFEKRSTAEPLFPEGPDQDAATRLPFDFAAAARMERSRMDAIPERDFVLGSRFQVGTLTLGAGPAGVSKSTFAIKSALAIASGKALTGEPVAKTGRVLIYNAEDPRDEIMRRVVATARVDGLDLELVHDRVRILSGYDDKRLVFAERRDRSGPIRPGEDLDELTRFVATDGIVHVALDPLVALHRGLDENAAPDMEALGDHLRRFATRAGVSVDLIHHTAKARGSQADAYAGHADAARGSGAVVGFVRSAYTLVPMGSSFAGEIGLEPERAAQMVRLDDAKRNYARRSARERWFEIVSALASGEIVPAAAFDSHDETVRRHASTSTGVHVPFDVNRQRALASVARADDEGTQRSAMLQFVVASMENDAVTRTAMALRFGLAMGLKETMARERLNALVPMGVTRAAEVEADGYHWTVWREERREGSRKNWVILRKRLGQIVRSEAPAEASNEPSEDVFG